MKQQSAYKLLIAFLFAVASVAAQKQTKTYIENYNVNKDAIINLNTSHTDIEFETWNKDQVEIEVVIAIEGASPKDMEKYFKQNELNITGNSRQISITSGAQNSWTTLHAPGGFKSSWDFNEFELPEIEELPEIAELTFMLDSLEFPEIPRINVPEFDFEAFKKEGDAYMKKWQKELDEGFSEKDRKAFKELEKKVESEQHKAEKIRQEMMSARESAYEERRAKLTAARAERLGELEERKELLEERRAEHKERRGALLEALKAKSQHKMHQFTGRRIDTILNDSISFSYFTMPNVYYQSSNAQGSNSKIKVKKYIKIKMPKSVTLKLNVRHGEVKLAENTKNIHGTFAYAGLYGNSIDGAQTQIDASYSPINIQNWNYGKLKVSYSDKVSIHTAKNITLSATSSEVSIGHLLQNIFAENNFGSLAIHEVNKDFSAIDVSVQNGTLRCELPISPFTITVNGENSKLIAPTILHLVKTKNDRRTLSRGYHISKNTAKNLTINAKYSTVVLE
ncbi:hypothetical protein [Cellulophaga baltica]|uniref:Adhesin domain-containing protein n=1 Tax=Cellulophaga baltica 18 TaxID=1348584 RepID=A0AAU8RP75_9FLAO|nr:hypothetical protein [Cellulophaga baltica]AIZ41971.1 hypothetical protein M666_10490 [Cellulophaga baltica 18]